MKIKYHLDSIIIDFANFVSFRFHCFTSMLPWQISTGIVSGLAQSSLLVPLEQSEENFDIFQRLDIVVEKDSYKIQCVVNYQISFGTHWV